MKTGIRRIVSDRKNVGKASVFGRLRRGFFLAVLFFTAVFGLSVDASAQFSEKFEGFIIQPDGHYIGEVQFSSKIKKAILLLKEKAPDEFAAMKRVIVKIRATRASGANYNEEVMTIDIANKTFNSTLQWLASVLIHETEHIRKYKDTGKKLGDAHLMTDKKAALQVMIDEELDCNRVQIAVLEKIGAAQYEIDYLKAQKGDHFDIDKDGDYDFEDYRARDW